MKKISRNEFMDRLADGESVFMGIISRHLTAEDAGRSLADTELVLDGMERRTVVKRQTNGVQFSNGSWLKFDQCGSYACYDLGNGLVMQWFESGGHNDNVHCHQAMLYKIVQFSA